MPRLPDHLAIIEASDVDHPFRMIAPPAHNFLNTSFTETSTGRRVEARPTALVHPDDCARLGLKDGDLVRVGNRRGEVLIHAKPFDGMQAGMVVVEGIWPNRDFEQGIGINALISAEAAPPMGGAGFHDAAVWLRPA
jgi:anaerobic selenocysteine-containing dehydrogenase